MEAPTRPAPTAFEQLMLPHLDAAYNLARWLLRNDHDAQDAVQDAFLRAFRAFDRFHGADGRAWLLTIVRNVCFSRLRQGRQTDGTEPFDEAAHGAVDDGESLAWREVRADLLQRALEQLAPEFREVIVLHELEGMAYREIAAIAAIPIGTVMSRLARARQKLQAELIKLAPQETAHGL